MLATTKQTIYKACTCGSQGIYSGRGHTKVVRWIVCGQANITVTDTNYVCIQQNIYTMSYPAISISFLPITVHIYVQ